MQHLPNIACLQEGEERAEAAVRVCHVSWHCWLVANTGIAAAAAAVVALLMELLLVL